MCFSKRICLNFLTLRQVPENHNQHIRHKHTFTDRRVVDLSRAKKQFSNVMKQLPQEIASKTTSAVPLFRQASKQVLTKLYVTSSSLSTSSSSSPSLSALASTDLNARLSQVAWSFIFLMLLFMATH